ncbi:unnamed protein product [Calypogeia fissa]
MIESVDASVIHSIAQLQLKFSASEARVQDMNARLQDMNGNVQQAVADLKRRRIREAVQKRDRDDEAERVVKKQKAEISFLKLDPDAKFMKDTADILIRDSITGKQILAHRLILASRSPVFKRKFETDTNLQMDLDFQTQVRDRHQFANGLGHGHVCCHPILLHCGDGVHEGDIGGRSV